MRGGRILRPLGVFQPKNQKGIQLNFVRFIQLVPFFNFPVINMVFGCDAATNLESYCKNRKQANKTAGRKGSGRLKKSFHAFSLK